MVILTGRPLFLESTVTTGSRYEVPLAPAAADLSGMTLIWDSGMRKMAAVRERILKDPWVLVQMVTWPSCAQSAVDVCGSMYPGALSGW